MSDDDDEVKRRVQGRSPPFPFVSLEKALARTADLLEYSKGHPVRVLSAVSEAWGYNPKSSGGIQTVGALKSFGLITDNGSNEERKIQVSEPARRLLRNPPPQIRTGILRELALRPKIINECFERWGKRRPPDSECHWYLVDERGFTEDAASRFLMTYDATLAYAGISGSDIGENAGSGISDIEVDMPEDPQPGYGEPASPIRGAPPVEAQPPAGTRKAVFPLEAGDVTLIFPDGLSAEGLEELSDYLEVFLRKAKRDSSTKK